MSREITQEIMRLYNCCENRAKEIISYFQINSEEKLKNHIEFLAKAILENTKE